MGGASCTIKRLQTEHERPGVKCFQINRIVIPEVCMSIEFANEQEFFRFVEHCEVEGDKAVFETQDQVFFCPTSDFLFHAKKGA